MDSQESSPTPQFKSLNSLALSLLYGSTLTSVHDYWRIIVYSGDSADFVGKVMSLLILSRFVIDFLQRSKHLLISLLQENGA